MAPPARSTLPGPSTSVAEFLNGTVPLGYQQIVGVPAATVLTIPTGATWALVSCVAQNINWRDDGAAQASAALGIPIIAGAAPVKLTNLAALSFCQQAAGATLNVSYYK